MRVLLCGWILLAVLAVSGRAEKADPEALTVVAEGMAALGSDPGAAEEEAVWDAKRNAVEKAVGVFLRARSVGRDFQIEESEIRARSDGFVKAWERVPGSQTIERVGNGKVLRLKIRAIVALLPVIQKLADMQDVYNDLERPRIRVTVEGGPLAERARATLEKAFRDQGFEISESQSAEVLLTGKLECVPTVKFGDRSAPYGVGESLAACRTRLVVRAVSSASEEALMTLQAEGAGQSFASDAEARSEAAQKAAENLLAANGSQFTHHLLIRWVRERQEGHAVVVKVSGLTGNRRALLREEIRNMRGFCRWVGETGDAKQVVLRFMTRLDTRGVRRRLAALRLENQWLAVRNERGPQIVCATSAPSRITRK